MMWKRMHLLVIVALALGLAGLQAAPAHAATTLTVGVCDQSHLASAVSQANSDNAGDTIAFSCDGTITLTSTLAITGGMIISGIGHNVTIDGGGAVQLFNAFNTTLGLNNLTLSNGSSSFAGAVYDNGGTLNVDSTTFSNNTTTSGSGGAIYVLSGTAHIS